MRSVLVACLTLLGAAACGAAPATAPAEPAPPVHDDVIGNVDTLAAGTPMTMRGPVATLRAACDLAIGGEPGATCTADAPTAMTGGDIRAAALLNVAGANDDLRYLAIQSAAGWFVEQAREDLWPRWRRADEQAPHFGKASAFDAPHVSGGALIWTGTYHEWFAGHPQGMCSSGSRTGDLTFTLRCQAGGDRMTCGYDEQPGAEESTPPTCP